MSLNGVLTLGAVRYGDTDVSFACFETASVAREIRDEQADLGGRG